MYLASFVFLQRALVFLVILLAVTCISSVIAMANSGAPVIYNYQDPGTGAIVNYVGIPGGPVVYSSVGPGGVNSVTSVNAGNPVVYSSVKPGRITSVTYGSSGNPAVYLETGPDNARSSPPVNPGKPVVAILTRQGG